MSQLQVQLGNTRVRVPMVGDERTTLRLAEELSERLKRIEAESERIDSQVFALRAAFELAAELYTLKAERDLEQHDLALILDRLVSGLQELRTRFSDLGK